ncbi:GntR family transcriptional regulator [Variovorax sp. UC74_104]|uniref:GntR family transcriptional regulator n=1 Tax=Variovorax sp. UC74_104 TaxID=3374555 RepID=UPI003757ACE9
MGTSSQIAQRILDSIRAGKLAAGDRIGEQPLAMLFDCSRTIVREALTELAVRGLVASSPRRGWYVVELTPEEARLAFQAREVIETAVLRHVREVPPATARRLREHVQRQERAIQDDDAGLRSFLLGDFHICVAECLGNPLISDTLRDLTARTMLVAMRHQSPREALRSCAEHAQIVEALEDGNLALAEKRMARHLRSWESKLHVPVVADNPLDQLRQALEPITDAGAKPADVAMVESKSVPVSRRSPARAARQSSRSGTYLGKLL